MMVVKMIQLELYRSLCIVEMEFKHEMVKQYRSARYTDAADEENEPPFPYRLGCLLEALSRSLS